MLELNLNQQGPEKSDALVDARFELEDRGTKWMGADGRSKTHRFELGPEDTREAVIATFEERIPGIIAEQSV